MARAGYDGKNYQRFPAHDEYLRFRTEALNLVRRTCGEESDHYRELRRLADSPNSADNSFYFSHCIGIVEAATRDFESGLLIDLRRLVTAEVLGDFLDQAEALLEAGYHVAAASLAGAVLEDAMRQLAVKLGVPLPAKTKLDRLNADLAKAGAYDKSVQKRIVAIADVRNNADHGHFELVSVDDATDMVKWVSRFSSDYLR